MTVSVFDLFKIGIGPSSSHTVGPMRAAATYVHRLQRDGILPRTARIRCELFGSLSATGKGHGSDKAVLLGLAGHAPDKVDVDAIPALLAEIRQHHRLNLDASHAIDFDEARDLVFNRRDSLPLHANGMRFEAFDLQGGRITRLLLCRRRLCRERGTGGGRRTPPAHRARHHCAAAALPQRRRPVAPDAGAGHHHQPS